MAVVRMQLDEMQTLALGSRRRHRRGVLGRHLFRSAIRLRSAPRLSTTSGAFPAGRTNLSHVRILGPCLDVQSYQVSNQQRADNWPLIAVERLTNPETHRSSERV